MTTRRIYWHGRLCVYCRRPMDRTDFWREPTRDHVVPRSQNGTRKVMACRLCNTVKGSAMPERWAAFMAANPGWWLLTKAEIRRAWRTLPADAVGTLEIVFYPPPPRQGSPPAKPPVVPPELIWRPSEQESADG